MLYIICLQRLRPYVNVNVLPPSYANLVTPGNYAAPSVNLFLKQDLLHHPLHCSL